MNDALSIVALLGFLSVLGLGAYATSRLTSLLDLVRPLEETLPDRPLLEKLHDLQVSLRESVEAQKIATLDLPRTVSGTISQEVKCGLEPTRKHVADLIQQSRNLSQGLQQSHERLSETILTLNQDGSLGEWAMELRGASRPFQEVGAALEHHYATAGQVLEKTGSLVEQWEIQRDAVVQAFQKFSLSVERSAAAETTHLRDIEHRLMNRLEEVAETNSTLSLALSELQTSGRTALETSADLASSVEKTRLQLAELIEQARVSQNQHQELIESQQRQQESFSAWEEGTREKLEKLGAMLCRIDEASAMSLASLRKGTQEMLDSLAGLSKSFYSAQSQALAQLIEAQEKASTRQETMVRKQCELVENLGEHLEDLPNRRDSRMLLGFLGAQVLATLLVLLALMLQPQI